MSDIRTPHGENARHCFRADHEPWREILDARRIAHAKHGPASIEAIPSDSPRWLPILVEEIGEVANALTYDGPQDQLRDELVDVAAVVAAWLAALDAS